MVPNRVGFQEGVLPAPDLASGFIPRQARKVPRIYHTHRTLPSRRHSGSPDRIKIIFFVWTVLPPHTASLTTSRATSPIISRNISRKASHVAEPWDA